MNRTARITYEVSANISIIVDNSSFNTTAKHSLLVNDADGSSIQVRLDETIINNLKLALDEIKLLKSPFNIG